ncbi:hypothetical protein B0H19DRAFT_1061721 [Mycena capillaripes]|nr:hypothetical protein B0H19DRAFT_1061721 [Mycena capillaripes]
MLQQDAQTTGGFCVSTNVKAEHKSVFVRMLKSFIRLHCDVDMLVSSEMLQQYTNEPLEMMKVLSELLAKGKMSAALKICYGGGTCGGGTGGGGSIWGLPERRELQKIRALSGRFSAKELDEDEYDSPITHLSISVYSRRGEARVTASNYLIAVYHAYLHQNATRSSESFIAVDNASFRILPPVSPTRWMSGPSVVTLARMTIYPN